MSKVKKGAILCFFLAMILAFSSQLSAQRRSRAGLSFGIGLGAMVASDATAYLGTSTDLYPEFQMVADFSYLRLGLSVGLVYRYEQDLYTGYYSGSYDFTQAYLPVLIDFSFLPLRLAAPNSTFQLYVGGCVGFYPGLADVSSQSYICAGPKFGMEFYFGDFFVLGFEGRYLIVSDNLSYFNALLNLRFRIPFVRRS